MKNNPKIKKKKSKINYMLGILLICLSIIPFLLAISSTTQNDIKLYYSTAESLLTGKLPYLDYSFEYPPYSIIWFLIPSLGKSLESFQFLFALEILIIDLAIKYFLLVQGIKASKGLKSLLPLTLYSLASASLYYFYFQRLDLIPAMLSLAVLIAFSRRYFFASGLLLSIAIGTKLYPIIFFLPLLVLSTHEKNGMKKFLLGSLVGFLPIILIGFFVPWWNFLDFHIGRGLEVESFWAALLWKIHLLQNIPVEWNFVKAWLEVTGPPAQKLLPYALSLWMATTAISIILIINGLKNKFKKPSLPQLAKIMLIPLLPFVIFNTVFSPQYMIWLLLLSAVASLSKNKILWLIPLCAMLTLFWYPSQEFGFGLNLFQTNILILRTSLLIAVWLVLLIEFLQKRKTS